MTDTLTADKDLLSAELALNGDDGADDTPQSPALSIAEASKAFRADPPAPSATPAADDTQTKSADERPRNPDGTFAKLNADGTPVAQAEDGAAPEGEDGAADDDTQAEEAPPEPKLLKLAGEPQRGEPDIELDVSDLPPEVVARLELNEKRGLRLKEYQAAMKTLETADADRIAFETRLTQDPVGVVLDHMPADKKVQVGAALLLDHWDQFAPIIETFWNDTAARMKALTEFREGSRTMSTQVQQQIVREQNIRNIGRTVDALIPDGIDAVTADEFRAAAWTRLQTLNSQGVQVTLELIPQHLTSLAARYGFPADGTEHTTAADVPKRPKLAVYNPAQPTGTTQTTGARQTTTAAQTTPSGVPTVTSMSPLQFQDKVRRQAGARAVAPQGAGGGGAARRQAISETATIEQASAALRGSLRK